KIQVTARLRQENTIETLIKIFATKDYQGLLKTNGNLKVEDLAQVLTSIRSYLTVYTYMQKTRELAKLSADIYKEASNWGSNKELRRSELENFVELASQKRKFLIEEHPEFLVFEYYMGFLLRDEQVQAIDKLSLRDRMLKNPDAKGAIVELIMGAGKTS